MKKFLIIGVLLITSIYPANKTIEKEVEQVAIKLLENIYKRNFEEILVIIPEIGLGDADSRIPKAAIKKDLNDKKSYLYKQLYSIPNKQELERCKASGSGVFSPYYFYKVNKKNYVIDIEKPFKDAEYYKVTFIAKKSIDSCKTILFSTSFYVENNKVMLESYFFSF